MCFVLIFSIGIKVHVEDPVADVFDLMEEINRVKNDVLWPGFKPGEIPTAIFDGINTYLFKYPSPPEEFMVLREREDTCFFNGQHSQVRGNSRVQLNGIWTATSVLRTHSRLTGRIPVDPGFAPGAIRHLGYLLGRWSAVILDRLEPNWKEIMESGQAEFLHEILKTTVSSSDHTCGFSDEEQESFSQKAKEDVENRGHTVQRLRKEFGSQPGYRIEFVSSKTPLGLLMFFADRTEALSQRELLHSFLLMLRNENGSLSVRDLMSITENDSSTGVVKLTVVGIIEKPVIENIEGKIKVTAKGFQAEFNEAEVEERQNVIKIVLR
jgi:hypothetical protein